MRKHFFFYSLLVCMLTVVGYLQVMYTDEPFIVSYDHDQIKLENEEKVLNWLDGTQMENDSKIHSYSLGDDYHYFYVKGYSDVLVSYGMDLKGDNPYTFLTANFKEGKPDDEVFIEIESNPLICCDGIVVDDSYKGE
ncbi:hypothetical protein [Caldalkalibacillus salinus]|uniref:hypothetical protein n=1 Tax=Caldalkalibacillus salinus TaxID=2803787 RepID=UPI00192394BD|nr:hypothetical protein [Caldalkalibacillus salinus]